MSGSICVLWTIVPCITPRPWLGCGTCGQVKPFSSSDKIRLNANGRRLDAWLIYKCSTCDATWNRPVIERQPVKSLDPDFLAALQANDPGLVRRSAFDLIGSLRRSWTLRGVASASWARRVASRYGRTVRALRRPVRDRAGVLLDLASEADGEAIAAAVTGGRPS